MTVGWRRAAAALGALALAATMTSTASAQTSTEPPSPLQPTPSETFGAAAPSGGGPSAPSGAIAPPRNTVPWLDGGAAAPAGGSVADVAAPPSSGAARPFDAQSLQSAPPGAGASPTTAPLGGAAPSAPWATRPANPVAGDGGRGGTVPPSFSGPAGSDAAASGASNDPFTATGPVFGDATIEVAELSSIRAASAGVAPASALGLPASAWRGATEAEAIALVDRLRPTALHAANRLAVDLLSLSFEPPQSDPGADRFDATGAAGGRAASDRFLTVDELGLDDLFTARLRALARFGAHDVAAELGAIGAAPLHPVAVDAALLSGRDVALCDALLSRPPASLDAAASVSGARSDPLSLTRIYCLTLIDDAGGAGAGAIAAIDAARSLGEGDETTLSLLAAAADPELAALVDASPSLEALTPLRLSALRRAGREPPSDYARAAPLERLSPQLDDLAPRARLEALERLEGAGAIATETLAAAYAEAESAESGGVWGRVEAYRDARAARLPDTIRAFRLALSRAAEAERDAMMARLLADDLAARASAGAPMRDAALRRALRLGGEGDAASALMSAEDRRAAGPEERALDRIAAPHWGGTWSIDDLNPLLARAARGDRRAGRLMAALNAFGVDTPDPTLYATPVDVAFARAEGRFALLAFGALARLSAGTDIAPEDLYAALRMLIAGGFGENARSIALEAVLLGD